MKNIIESQTTEKGLTYESMLETEGNKKQVIYILYVK